MKTLQIVGFAFCATTLCVGLSGCTDDKAFDEPVILKKVIESDKQIVETPVTTIEATKGAELAKTVNVTDSNAPFSKIVLADDMTITLIPATKTRASGNGVLTGTYEVVGDKIIANIEGYTISMPVDGVEDVVINETTYTATEGKSTTDATTMSLCRTWYPTYYQVVLYSGSKAYGNYEASTIEQLEAIVGKDANTTVELLKGEVEKITFLNDNTIMTVYNGSDTNVATWEWMDKSNGEFKASFGDKAKFQNLKCTVRYEAGTPNKACIVVNFDIDMKGKDKEPFTANAKTIITLKDAK